MTDTAAHRLDPIACGLIAAYAGCIWLANWLLFNVGTPGPGGIHTIPVWPGVAAPSGVLAAGATLTLRDAVQRRSGLAASFVAVLLGTTLTALVSPAAALASGTAFLVAELLDLGVYTRLRRRFAVAVFASNLVGSVVDSVLFLSLAFGATAAASLTIPSAVGKLEASVITLMLLGLLKLGAPARGQSMEVAPTGTPIQ